MLVFFSSSKTALYVIKVIFDLLATVEKDVHNSAEVILFVGFTLYNNAKVKNVKQKS